VGTRRGPCSRNLKPEGFDVSHAVRPHLSRISVLPSPAFYFLLFAFLAAAFLIFPSTFRHYRVGTFCLSPNPCPANHF